MNYNQGKIRRLRKDWFIPEDAKEYFDRKNNPWKIGKRVVSGKQWILKNCELFKTYGGDIFLINKIRNGESHFKTIINDRNVILIDGKNTTNITAEIENLWLFLQNCLTISKEFHLRLIVLHRFWITPAILLTIPQKFKYRKKIVLFDILKDVQKEGKKAKIDFSDNSKMEMLQVFFFSALEFTLSGIWQDLKSNQVRIDNFLAKAGLHLDLVIVDELRQNALDSIYEILAIFEGKVKQLIFKENITEITISEGAKSAEDLLDKIGDISNQAKQILTFSQVEQIEAGKTFMLFSGISLGMGLIIPLHELKKSFKNLFVEIV